MPRASAGRMSSAPNGRRAGSPSVAAGIILIQGIITKPEFQAGRRLMKNGTILMNMG